MLALMMRDILPLKRLFLAAIIGSVVLLPISTVIIPAAEYQFPIGPVLVLFVFGFLLCGMTFQSDEKYKTDIIICSMPYSRARIVISRYVLTAIVFIVMTMLGLVSQKIFGSIAHQEAIENPTVGYTTGCVLGLILVFLTYPAYYKFGLVGGQAVLFIVFFSVSFLGSSLLKNIIYKSTEGNAGPFISWLVTLNAPQRYALTILFILFIGAVSLLLSVRCYEKREY